MRHGSQLDPPNRFEAVHATFDPEHFEGGEDFLDSRLERSIEYIPDHSRSIVSQNDSPDIAFRYSVNPYRGCIHACSYCYARPSHEYLGLNAGLDFETRIFVKHEAASLFADFLRRPRWKPEPVVFSGVTDCYQPAERKFRLTRGCLQVAHDCRVPISIITKNALVLCDLDLLQPMADHHLVHVGISLTTLDPELSRQMEPRTSIPAARLRAIEVLAKAGVPVRVMTAPMIPGLNDHELPSLMKAAREAGATDASYTMLRLPLTVRPVFLEWLERNRPLQMDKVTGLIRAVRGGALNSSEWGQRMSGEGPLADQLRNTYQIFYRKLGFQPLAPQRVDLFQPPRSPDGQLTLF